MKYTGHGLKVMGLNPDWVELDGGGGVEGGVVLLSKLYLNRSLIAEWLRQQHFRDMKPPVHELEIMGSNPGRVELEVNSAFV